MLAQFVLMNISAAFYAYKLTHFRTPTNDTWTKPVSNNIFAKTWRLFSGPTCYKQVISGVPDFPFSTVILMTSNGISIEAWYGKTDSISKGTVILFHGLMDNKRWLTDEADAFRIMGYNVMMVDARNHGNSGGEVTTIGYNESEEVKLSYEHISQAGEKNIFLWGASMGAVEVIKAVSDFHLQPSGIIIDAPFYSLQSHLEGRARALGFPSQPFGFLTSFWIGMENGFNGLAFKTTRYAREINCPVLMEYGKNDKLVLRYETDAIFNAIASANKKLTIYDNAGHEYFLRNDPAMWNKEVEIFLKRCSKATF